MHKKKLLSLKYLCVVVPAKGNFSEEMSPKTPVTTSTTTESEQIVGKSPNVVIDMGPSESGENENKNI